MQLTKGTSQKEDQLRRSRAKILIKVSTLMCSFSHCPSIQNFLKLEDVLVSFAFTCGGLRQKSKNKRSLAKRNLRITCTSFLVTVTVT